ncbi:MAG: hypothetical protein QM529_07565 [Hydrotalea sp.]|nr:hypothetical protein [Hydrotalea sp.]
MKNKILIGAATILASTTLSTLSTLDAIGGGIFTNHANAQAINADGKLMPSSSGAVGQNLMPSSSGAVGQQLTLKADVGYVYSFAGDWNKSTAESPSIGGNTSTATGGVGYGVSLGLTSKTGFGLSADYLGFNHKWTGLGTNVNSKTEFNYDASYHVITLVPNYRIKLDSADHWGLRFGLGLGFSISDVNWTQKINNGAQSLNGAKLASGATFSISNSSKDPYLNETSGVAGDIHTCYHHVVINSLVPNGIISDSNITIDPDYVNLSPLKNSCWFIDGFNSFVTVQVPNTGTIDDAAIANWLITLGVTSDGKDLFYNGQSILTNKNIPALGISINTEELTLANGVAADILSAVKVATDEAAARNFGGSAKDDAGFVLAPQVALEYDNGLLHADINVKYIHELFNVRYSGSEGSVSATKSSGEIAYTSKAGPLALFIGTGLGVNF